MSKPDIVDIAVHEASHCVTNILGTGCHFDRVEVNLGGKSGVFGVRHHASCKGKCAIGGLVGERLARLDCAWNEEILEGCKTDLEKARSDNASPEIFKRRIERTARMLSKRWDAVCAIANTLIRHKSLTYSQVEAIIASHPPKKERHEWKEDSFSPIVTGVIRHDEPTGFIRLDSKQTPMTKTDDKKQLRAQCEHCGKFQSDPVEGDEDVSSEDGDEDVSDDPDFDESANLDGLSLEEQAILRNRRRTEQASLKNFVRVKKVNQI